MLIKVTRGYVRNNGKVYAEGETLEVEDSEALTIIKNQVAEEVKEEVKVSRSKAKKEEVVEPEVVVEEKPVEVDETADLEPSIDWTRAELDEYAKKVGIEDPETLPNKEDVLEAILTYKEVNEK
jgi:DNA repair exonuclease SbcCD nuclease subunit